MIVAESPEFLESVANHPRVYPHVSVKGCGEIRFCGIWGDCIALQWDDGGFLFHRQDDGVYEVHTLFLPRAKDKDAKAREALAHMFNSGARLVVTQIARDLPHVRRFAKRHGFKWYGERLNAYERDSGPVDVDYFELEGQGCPQPSQ